jgi:hypothetical protein
MYAPAGDVLLIFIRRRQPACWEVAAVAGTWRQPSGRRRREGVSRDSWELVRKKIKSRKKNHVGPKFKFLEVIIGNSWS